jgi:riboflavin biosynthesis pyrimidine reductase
VRLLFPPASSSAQHAEDLDDAALARLYGYPGQPWLRANMVMSADGAATLDGRSGGLSSKADRRLFALLRGLADVILAGAGTARAEGYKPVRPREVRDGLRAGRGPTPPIAIVSRALDLDPDAPLFTKAPAWAKTIVITCAASPASRRDALARHADVVVAGQTVVDLGEAVAVLRERGLNRVLCEGGPHLLAGLVRAGLLDELDLTVGPLLAGPGENRITAGTRFSPHHLRLAGILEEEGALFCRYTRPVPASAPPAPSQANPLFRCRGRWWRGVSARMQSGTSFRWRDLLRMALSVNP